MFLYSTKTWCYHWHSGEDLEGGAVWNGHGKERLELPTKRCALEEENGRVVDHLPCTIVLGVRSGIKAIDLLATYGQ
ncbi:hypothetical protein ACH5RR_035382 [Cinchona calisaya]|uniref:Uncharacterized protein n=1 Tax=Cinchona calisaya TaxID=153742 RepID=A0ABD2YFP8_9GENT